MGKSSTCIKICGITNLDDARAAARAGVDYLGYILYERSPRFVGTDTIRGITETLRHEHPDIQHIGVFVNEPLDNLCETLDAAKLDCAQLHGAETPEFAQQLLQRGYRYIRAMRFGSGAPAVAWTDFPDAAFYLCDTYDPKEAGGTGRAFDHTLLPAHMPRERLFLAGGLTVANVAEAVLTVQPFAVDVSSGVEEIPGKKCPEKIAAFCATVKQAATTAASN